MKEIVRLAVIGTSARAHELAEILWKMKNVALVAVCDVNLARAEEFAEKTRALTGGAARAYADYRLALRHEGLDGALICTSWYHHSDIALEALDAGLYVGLEVGGFTSVDECWEIVRARKNAKPIMLLENFCYGREELALLNMARGKLFGELVHAAGMYANDQRKEIYDSGKYTRYRVESYRLRNGNLYPTHPLGPLAKILEINRGNRIVSVSCVASKGRGMNRWVEKNVGFSDPLASARFALGDVVTTVLSCARGETIVLTHDTSLPRPFARNLLLQGTDGIYEQARASVFFEGHSPTRSGWMGNPDPVWEPFAGYLRDYDHALWRESLAADPELDEGTEANALTLRAFVDSVARGAETPIDAYDLATWLSITPLSEISAANGGAPVGVPDFTAGAWIERGEPEKSAFALRAR